MYPITAAIIVQTKDLWEALHAALNDLAVRVVFEQHDITDWPAFNERLTRTTPDLLLFDVNSARESIEEVIGRIKAVENAPAVVALNTDANPEAILASLRAGAAEYLYPPFTDGLRRACERIGAQREKTRASIRKGGRTLGFVSAKGGCGATTISCHVAVEMAAQTKTRVLLADLDVEAGLIGFLMKSQSGYSVADAVTNLHRLDPSYWRALVSNGYPDVEVVSAPSTPTGKQIRLADLQHVLSFARTQYEWTVADLGRNINAGSLSTLESVDETYVISTLELSALHQAKQMIRLLAEAGYGRDRLRLILNRLPRRTDLTIEEVEKMLGASVFATIPNDYEPLQEALAEGKLLSPGSGLGKHYTRIARKLAGLEDAPKKRFGLFG